MEVGFALDQVSGSWAL